jgi:hypothetical protein
MLAAGSLAAQVEPPILSNGSPVPNWTVPAYHQSSAGGGLSTMTDISYGSSFVAMTPCRVFDTRNAVGPYGGPRLVASVTRDFDIDGGACGPIPGTAFVFAYSMNFGAILPDGANSFVTIWPSGSAMPTVSSINPILGGVVANAAIVPRGSGGSISVFPNTGLHLYGDINGYFTSTFNPGNFLVQVGSNPGGGVGFFVNSSTASNSAGVFAGYGAGFTDNTGCCGPGGVIAKGAFNGVAGVAQDRAVVGLLASGAGNYLAEGQLGKSGASATQGYGVVGTTAAALNANDSAAVRGDSLATAGRVYGGRFSTASDSDGAAGVIGFSSDASLAGAFSARRGGVIGVAGYGNGVYGVSVNYPPGVISAGVIGNLLNGTGTVLSGGVLGYDSTHGVYFYNGLAGTGVKSFVEPHPTDASKVIQYISLEGNEAGTYFRGRGKFENGIAVIEVPSDFRMVTDREGLGIQVTPIGQMATVAVESIGLERIVVRGSRNVEFFYTVNGVRRAYPNPQIIAENEKFFVPESPDGRLPAYLSDDEKQRLIDNGTYRPDGTVNMETARRLGWDRRWEEQPKPVTSEPSSP